MCKKKTILYIAQPTHGGAIEYLYMFLKNIDKTKYNNILVLSEDYIGGTKRFEDLVESIYFLPMSREIKIGNVLKSVSKLKRILKKEKPSIIYMHSSMAGAVGRIANLFNFKVKLLYNAHGWYFNAKISKKKKKFYALIERILALRTTKIINISKSEYDSALKYKIAPERKMCVIENGIDFTKFEGCDKYREETRKKYNIGDNEIVIGVVGRLSEQKDPMTTIKAFNEVYKENKNVRLMYVGSGELENEVMEYAKENNLQHLVTITGWVDNTERYIPAFDIAILPSKWEGFGLAIIEYMACKKPIVASNVGGIADIIKDNENGFLIEKENYNRLTQKVIEILNNKEEANSFIKNNNAVIYKYNIKNVTDEHLKLIDKLCTNRGI